MDEFQTNRERMSEQFRILRENTHVLEWWWKELREIRSAYDGVVHTQNLQAADSVNQRQEMFGRIQALEETVERLAIERDEANAAIGKLQSDLAALSKRMDRMAEWAKKVKA